MSKVSILRCGAINDIRTFSTVSATLKRNQSLTKDEIDAYWKSKKMIEEEHLIAISNLSKTIQV